MATPARPVYPSKVDWWLAVLLVSVPVIAVGSAIVLTIYDEPIDALVGWLSVAAVAALYVGVVWPVAYELDDEALVIRFGLIRIRIRYDRIRDVRPTRSLLASPALSLDRLAVDRGGGLPVTISPADPSGFLADLDGRTPHLRRDGDRLVGATRLSED